MKRYIKENDETLWQRQERIDEWKDNVAVYLDRAFGMDETDRIMKEYKMVLNNLFMNGLDDEKFAADFIEDDIKNFNGKYNDKNIKKDSKAWNEFIKEIHNITHRGLDESLSVDRKNQLLQDYIECLNDRDFDIELRNNILYINGEEVLNVGGYAVQFKIYLISKELYERGYFD